MQYWRAPLFFLVLTFSLFSYSSQDQGKLVVTNSASWPPFSFINEEGNPDGILVDLWQEFAVRNQIEVEFVLTDWSSSLELIRHHKADVHAGLFESEERDQYMDFSATINVPLATRLFVSQKMKVDNILELTVPVAVTKGGFAETFINEHYPTVELQLFDNGAEAIQAAVDGDVFAFVSDYPAAMYYLHKLGTPEQFYVVQTLYRENLKAAVPDGNLALLTQVNHGLDAIPVEEFNRIIQKWMYSESRIPSWLFPVLAVSVFAMILVFAGIYIFTLKRQVESRTKQLEQISISDGLTGIYNRKKIESKINDELARSQRYNKDLSIVLIDIDHFKQVNDQYGHLVGDEVLKGIVALFSDNIRQVDSIGRWGGEEFLIVCPETSLSDAVKMADKLRAIICAASFPIEGGCTASFGVAELKHSDQLAGLLKRADEALYLAKNGGRNQVSFV